ncbi:MAG TPA: hypothetical protein VFH78_04080 [Candidatus Thermoplasmatota archaeon]|nr:hypothetical protein [Candidatus Thermoplasmatota archaeon]
MPQAKKRSEVDAVHAIHDALVDLDRDTRERVLASVRALLGMERQPEPRIQAHGPPPVDVEGKVPDGSKSSARPLGLNELIIEKKPGTNPEYLATFAYFHDKRHGSPYFSRRDLEPYFAKAHVPAPGNYDRDFAAAVKHGWIYEDGDESYLTTKGIEVVERGFDGADGRRKPKGAKPRAKASVKPKAKKSAKR